ncbi:MAG: vitamin B12 dependent-methionine synthase activation domain-containing protein [bacterium]
MNRIVQFNLTDIMPEHEAVLLNLGFSKGVTIKNKIQALLTKALDMFTISAQPIGLIGELSSKEFEIIFRGEGENSKETPLEHIFPQAESLALFALTMGREVSVKIEELFKNNDFALGSMLDSVASLAADKAVEVFEAYFHCHCYKPFDSAQNDEEISLSKRANSLSKQGDCLPNSSGLAMTATPDNWVLSYSPGYCGWHISGQKKLFQYLHPERIGISLNDSFLMSPLKSVTGVLVSGKKDIHFFESNYSFCRFCKTKSCRARMKRVLMA